MKKIEAPNYTQVPNIILDNINELGLAELKVLLAICRNTFGFHTDHAALSHGEICKVTGLSRSSVQVGVDSLITRGWITKKQGERTLVYEVVLEVIDDRISGRQDLPLPNSGIEPYRNSVEGVYRNSGALYKESTFKERKKDCRADAPNPDHRKFIQLWEVKYRERLKRPYRFQGGKDAKAVSELLIIPGETCESLLVLAERAWAKIGDKFSRCHAAGTIFGYSQRWQDIKNELDPPQKKALRDYSFWSQSSEGNESKMTTENEHDNAAASF